MILHSHWIYCIDDPTASWWRPISPKPVGVWISSFLMDLSDRMCHHLRNIIVIWLLFLIMIYTVFYWSPMMIQCLREVNVACCFCSRYDLTVSPFRALSLGFSSYDPSLALNTLYWRSYCILMSPRGQLHCLQCQGPSPQPVGVWISSFLMDFFW